MGHPDTIPIIALAEARLIIEQLQLKADRVDILETELEQLRAEVALLRNGGAIGHSAVVNGADEASQPAPGHSYETRGQVEEQENDRAIGHSEVTNGPLQDPSEEASHSYVSHDPGSSDRRHGAIGHSGVTNGLQETGAEEPPNSYEPQPESDLDANRRAIGHYEVTDGAESASAEGQDSYESEAPGRSQGDHGAIGHSEVTNGFQEGQAYLVRRARVEELVMAHGAYYRRSFSRRGLPGAVEYFSRSDENEQELLRQVRILEAGDDPQKAGTDAPPDNAAQAQEETPDRYAFDYCPDCGKPFATYGGAEYCTDCTQRRRMGE